MNNKKNVSINDNDLMGNELNLSQVSSGHPKRPLNVFPFSFNSLIVALLEVALTITAGILEPTKYFDVHVWSTDQNGPLLFSNNPQHSLMYTVHCVSGTRVHGTDGLTCPPKHRTSRVKCLAQEHKEAAELK